MALTIMLSITFRSCAPNVNGISELSGHDPTLSKFDPLVPIVTLLVAQTPFRIQLFPDCRKTGLLSAYD